MTNKTIKIISVLLSILIISIFIFSIIFQSQIKELIISSTKIYTLSFFSISLISAAIELIPQYFSAHILILILISSDISPILLFSSISIGSIIGSLISFEIGRVYGIKVALSLFERKKIQRISNLFLRHSKWFVSLAAISPIPYFPVIFGLLKMSRKDFILFGIIPRTISFILLIVLIRAGFSLFQ